MKTSEQKNKFIDLRAKGYSYDKISNEIDVSKPTLINWGQDFKREITNLKAIEQEHLQEKYLISKKKQIEIFGKMLKKINKELDKRDLSDMETKDLLNYSLKVAAKLEDQREVLRVSVEADPNKDFIDTMSHRWKELI
jgi:transposase